MSDHATSPSPLLVPDHNGDTTTSSPATAQSVFATREELLAYVTHSSLTQGFAVVIHKSNVPRGQLWLRCDMGGASRNLVPPLDAKRKRKNVSRLQNCPYQLYGRRMADGSWVVTVQNDHHNHVLNAEKQALELHPTARRLTDAQKRLVVEMTDVGIRPAVIVNKLKDKFPHKPIKVQDIYNARNYIRKERLAGRVPFPEAWIDLEQLRGDEDGDGNDEEEGAPQPRALALSAAGAGSDAASSSSAKVVVDDLQRVWSSVMESMPTWPSEKQNKFAMEVQAIVKKFQECDEDDSTTTTTTAVSGGSVEAAGELVGVEVAGEGVVLPHTEDATASLL